MHRSPRRPGRTLALSIALSGLVSGYSGAAGPTPTPVGSEIVASGAQLQRLASGMQFIEGPIWIPASGSLVFSDINANEMKRWSPAAGLLTFRKPSNKANGNALDRMGRLVTCEHGARRVSRTQADGTVVTLVERYQGKRFNSPNDVVVKSDGTIWFTDPDWGIEGRTPEVAGKYVYRYDPTSATLTVVAADFVEPNGLCFSPDETKLYIGESIDTIHNVRVFDVGAGATLANGRLFATIDKGVPDGLRCDEQGRLFAAARDGVQVFDTNGRLLTRILVPETVTNLCFGGADYKTLYMTATTSLYSIPLAVRGADRR